MEQPEPKLATMPIDQYGRYITAAHIIKKLIAEKNQKKVKILDIGGNNGETHKFFNPDEVDITIVDVDEGKGKNYIQASALDMPFKDNSFDYVVSFEVFEHIPKNDREAYIKEAMRVCSGEFILTAPFSGKHEEVLKSEININNLWKNIHNQDHRWLREHIEYGTPKVEELELILKHNKLLFQKIGNNDLMTWNLMLSFMTFSTLFQPTGLNPDVQSFYNKNSLVIDSNTDYYYRYIYIIGRELTMVDSYKLKQIPAEYKVQTINTLINKVFMKMSNYVIESNKKRQNDIDNVLAVERKNVEKLRRTIQEKDEAINRLEKRILEIESMKLVKIVQRTKNAKNKLMPS